MLADQMSEFEAKMHQIRLSRPRCGAYSAAPEGPDPVAVFKGPTSKGKGMEGKGVGEEAKIKGR